MPQTQRHPLSFDVEAAKAGISSRIPIGVRPIRVKRIVGSAGKADKLGPDFRPLGPGPAQSHYQTIFKLMKDGTTFPEITVYQISTRYFVADGHTRVAAAKELKIEFIDASVTECLPKKEGEINLTFYARREFERATGLEGVRLTAPWRYHLLQHHVEGYRLYLERSTEREVTLPEAGRIWFRTQYSPTLIEIRRRKLKSATGGRTAGDVYTDILKAWAEREGLAISLREMLDQYSQTMQAQEGRLSRARRVVTDVVDASLPKLIPPLSTPKPAKFTEGDVAAELGEDMNG